MHIAILYMCTGRYSIFWDGFFESCERYFAPGHNKEYFVFTDQSITHTKVAKVHRIEQSQLGWPDITLKRYHLFESIQERLLTFESIFFFNANVRFCDIISDKDLPSEDFPLVFQQHPGYYNKPALLFPYERNKASRAYIPRFKGRHYLAGGINGGLRDAYFAMIAAIKNAVDADLKNGIVARWHDESHLNRYALDKTYKLWHPGYAMPDSRNLPFPRMIRLVDKRSVGGHDFMRGVNKQRPKTLAERFVFRPSFPRIMEGAGCAPLVVARLLGGLGNQMFIYASAYALAKRLGGELAVDVGALQSDKNRRYELHRFGLMDPQWRVPKGCDKLVGVWSRFRKRLGGTVPWTHLKSPSAYTPCLELAAGNCYLTGYWQSPKYFESCADDIRSVFSCAIPETETVKDLQAYINSGVTVAVHLRRGDYTDLKNMQKHGILPLDYYERAKSHLESLVPQCQYLVFSDDPDEAGRLFGHWQRCRIVPRQDHLEDLMLMRSCRHAIIANSSFGWWGAWLGQTEGQQVIAPLRWFAGGGGEPFAVNDLFPTNWVVL